MTPSYEARISGVYRALAATAWVAWRYADRGDADDYVQTVQIGKSLIACGGFDHADLVARFREPPGYTIDGDVFAPGGVNSWYKGQVRKLLMDPNPLYEAEDGVSDGAAMKMAAVAAFYADDMEGLVRAADRIARITHAAVEARLAAALVALRLRRVLLGIDPDNPGRLVDDVTAAAGLLGVQNDAGFFLARVTDAAELVGRYPGAVDLLYHLSRHVGMKHVAWSTPVSASFWSFHRDTDYGKWFRRRGEKVFYAPHRRFFFRRKLVTGETLHPDVFRADEDHLRDIGRYDEFMESHGYHWKEGLDIDTFLSIAISVLAVRHGLESIAKEVDETVRLFGDDLQAMSEGLVAGRAPA